MTIFCWFSIRGRFRKRNLKHAKECSIQQRRGFACGVCRWKRRFGCSRNSAVSAARFESGFRERDGQGQHWRGPHSHGGFLKMIVCESGGHANGLTYFIFRFLRRPLIAGRPRAELNLRLSSEILLFGTDAKVNAGDVHGCWPKWVYGTWLTIDGMANKAKHDVNCPQPI